MRKTRKTKTGARVKKPVAKKAVAKKAVTKKPVAKKAVTKKTPQKRVLKGKKVTRRAPAPKKINAIPKKYHRLTPQLIVDSPEKAIDFYQKAFGAKLLLKIETHNKIRYAKLKIGDSNFMLSDGPTDGSGTMGLYFYVKNVDKIMDHALSLGAKLKHPIENKFWGDRSGSLEDPFGYHWTLATHIENVSTRELKKRAAQFAEE